MRVGDERRKAERRAETDDQQAERDAERRCKTGTPPDAGAEDGEVGHVRARRQLDHQASDGKREQRLEGKSGHWPVSRPSAAFAAR